MTSGGLDPQKSITDGHTSAGLKPKKKVSADVIGGHAHSKRRKANFPSVAQRQSGRGLRRHRRPRPLTTATPTRIGINLALNTFIAIRHFIVLGALMESAHSTRNFFRFKFSSIGATGAAGSSKVGGACWTGSGETVLSWPKIV